MMLSEIALPRIKADWLRCIISVRVIPNLLAKIFDIVLYITLQHDIGLKSVTNSGIATLGIKVIIVEFACFNIIPMEKKLHNN